MGYFRKTNQNSPEKKMRKLLIYTFLFLISLISVNYFFAVFLPSAFKNLRFLFLIITSLWGIYLLFQPKYKSIYDFPLKIIIFSMLFAAVMAWLTWDQPIYYGLLITLQFFIWPIYYILRQLKITISEIEFIVIFFSLLYTALYLYQFFNPSTVLFNEGMVEDEYREVRGIIRIIFPGAGFFWLGIYISITKLTSNKSKMYGFWFFMMVLGIVIQTMQVTRTFIIPIILVYLYHFTKTLSIKKKLIIVIAFMGLLIVAPNIDIPIIDGMIERTQQTADDGTKDIRYIATEFFISKFPPSILNYFFGNGIGHQGSGYGQYMQFLASEKGYHISDIGIFGVYTYFGIFYVLGWAILAIMIINTPVSKDKVYVKYFFFNILFGAFTGSTLYHMNFIMAIIFALYILEKDYKIQNLKKFLHKINIKRKAIEKITFQQSSQNQEFLINSKNEKTLS